MKRVLVTGGSGFIGRYTCEELAYQGFDPVVFDHVRHDPSGYEVYLGDIRDDVAVNEAVAHVDGVIHLGGVLGTQETINNPRPAAHTNILGGLNVLEATSEYNIPLVNIAVGNWWMNNTYSITKNSIERFCEMYVRFRHSRISVVRALNAYGPRQVAATPYGPSHVRKIMPSFCCKALTGIPIEVYGDGDQIMDMIYVTDVAKILVKTLIHTHLHGALPGPVEAGTGRKTTVNDIAELVVEEANRLTSIHAGVTHLPMRPGEDEKSVVLGDPSTLSLIDFDPAGMVPLEKGVEATVAYFHDYLRQ